MRAPARRRILLVLDDCGPGDALRIGGCLAAVREQNPDAELVLLVGVLAAPVYERSLLFDRVVVSRLYSKGAPGRARRARLALEAMLLLARLHGRFDLVITFYWGTTLLTALSFALGRRRIGYSQRLQGLLSSRLGAYDPNQPAPAQNLALLRAAGLRAADKAAPPRIFGADDLESAACLLERSGIAGGAPLAVLHPGSDWACQQWLPRRWGQLAERLATDHGLRVVLTGTADEAAYNDAIVREAGGRALSLAGDTDLGQLAALIARARLCVCVDSVAFELAAAAATPSVVLAAPTQPEAPAGAGSQVVVLNRTGPAMRTVVRRCQARFPHGRCHNYGCPMAGLRSLTLADVLAAAEALLSRTESPRVPA